jgi:hypothetical protein
VSGSFDCDSVAENTGGTVLALACIFPSPADLNERPNRRKSFGDDELTIL